MLNKPPVFTFGCDPEVFLFDKETGDPVSCHDLLPGTKENPYKVNRGALQVDGTAAEFNIQPVETANDFVTNTTTVLDILSRAIKNPNLQVVATPVVKYKPEYFYKLPKSALELGCNPDYNAYTMKENPRPDSSRLKGLETMRTGSGHIHIGWNSNLAKENPEAHFLDCVHLVRNLDYAFAPFIGIFEPENERSKLYGGFGCFRPKPFGVEYRTLSNFWLKDKGLIHLVCRLAKRVINVQYENRNGHGLYTPLPTDYTNANQTLQGSSQVYRSKVFYTTFEQKVKVWSRYFPDLKYISQE